MPEYVGGRQEAVGAEGARRDVLVRQAARQVLCRGGRGVGGLQQGALEGRRPYGHRGEGSGFAVPARTATACPARAPGRALGARRSPNSYRQALAELSHAFAGYATELAPGGFEPRAAAAVPAPMPDGDLGRAAGLRALCDRGQFGLE